MRSKTRALVVVAFLAGALGGAGCSANSATPGAGGDAGDSENADAGADAAAVADAGAGADARGSEGGDAVADSGPAGDGGRDYSTDRAKFFGDSRCANAGVQLCEDFESGMVNSAIWTTAGTKPVVDGVQHARGSHALHITQPGNGLSYIKESTTFPEPNDTYYGRVFVYFKTLPTPTAAEGDAAAMTYAHWTMLAASGTGVPGEIRVSGQLQNGKNLFGVGTDNRTDGGTGDWTTSDNDPKGAPTPVPTGQWLCIEWLHKGDTSESQFWWDGASHPSLTTSASKNGGNGAPYLLPEFTSLWIGWQEYQATSETFELWIDEIAVDRQRIGCVL
jgi:hypothetical protein